MFRLMIAKRAVAKCITARRNARRITDGGKALRAFLDDRGISVPNFCEAQRPPLDRIQVQRVLNGERWQRISVDFADAVSRATKGAVDWRLFLSRTARPANHQRHRKTGS